MTLYHIGAPGIQLSAFKAISIPLIEAHRYLSGILLLYMPSPSEIYITMALFFGMYKR